jgi:putative transposase
MKTARYSDAQIMAVLK